MLLGGRISIQIAKPTAVRLGGLLIVNEAAGTIVPDNIASWLTQSPVQVPANFVGMHFNRLQGRPTYRYGHARTHDHDPEGNGSLGTQWRQIEPTQGDRYTATLAAFCRTHGVDTIWTMGGTPAWAARDPDVISKWGSLGGGSMPHNGGELLNVIDAGLAAAARVVEVWNEPEPTQEYAAGWFNGSPTDLATLTKWQRTAIDGRAKLIGPAFTDISAGSGWKVDAYALALGAGVLDAFSWHCYIYEADPKRHALAVATQCRQIRAQVDATELRGLPLWLTEMGCDNAQWSALPADQQAACVARWLIVAAALGMQRCTLYAHELRYCGAPASNPAIAAAIDRTHRLLSGQTIRAAAILTDGRVWIDTGVDVATV